MVGRITNRGHANCFFELAYIDSNAKPYIYMTNFVVVTSTPESVVGNPVTCLTADARASLVISPLAESNAKRRQLSSISTIAEDEDDKREGNVDSNMSLPLLLIGPGSRGRVSLTRKTTIVGVKAPDIVAMATTAEWTLMNRSETQP
ncbi:hypothetical protein FRC05_004194 [Tulasnella sp. 425]|nr:hypothetical protein FRC05_004194 [Tulasnella sp. 425]